MPQSASSPSSQAPDPSSALAELSVIADTLDRHRDRIAGAAEPFLGTEREDVVQAIHEAERQLNVAVRSLRRAIRTLGA